MGGGRGDFNLGGSASALESNRTGGNGKANNDATWAAETLKETVNAAVKYDIFWYLVYRDSQNTSCTNQILFLYFCDLFLGGVILF